LTQPFKLAQPSQCTFCLSFTHIVLSQEHHLFLAGPATSLCSFRGAKCVCITCRSGAQILPWPCPLHCHSWYMLLPSTDLQGLWAGCFSSGLTEHWEPQMHRPADRTQRQGLHAQCTCRDLVPLLNPGPGHQAFSSAFPPNNFHFFSGFGNQTWVLSKLCLSLCVPLPQRGNMPLFHTFLVQVNLSSQAPLRRVFILRMRVFHRRTAGRPPAHPPPPPPVLKWMEGWGARQCSGATAGSSLPPPLPPPAPCPPPHQSP
jgi:hypothetical protein